MLVAPTRRSRRITNDESVEFPGLGPVSPRPGKTLKGVALKANLPVVQLRNAFNEVFEGAAKPIQLPDNDSVTSTDVGECFY
jgi:uncharacterized protein (DUF2126 family)